MKYYVIVIDTKNILSVKSIGYFDDEDSALTQANKYGRLNKLNIIWTCTEDNIKQLKNSIKNETD